MTERKPQFTVPTPFGSMACYWKRPMVAVSVYRATRGFRRGPRSGDTELRPGDFFTTWHHDKQAADWAARNRFALYSGEYVGTFDLEGHPWMPPEEDALGRLAYAMARHIRNTDQMPAVEWGPRGMRLLEQLRELDPARYDREVK